ncbi:MAG: hypothetical protein EZS28_016243 [Streblomastix strix]|uniref:Uncharacterized protein n=1 Tax=Streblomastix strix TaxID=222440 RepID=A0A5J4W067_9EUKA|nr:MAG: hypothetical protein EZS28_016243 [Streblomastix strix]
MHFLFLSVDAANITQDALLIQTNSASLEINTELELLNIQISEVLNIAAQIPNSEMKTIKCVIQLEGEVKMSFHTNMRKQESLLNTISKVIFDYSR